MFCFGSTFSRAPWMADSGGLTPLGESRPRHLKLIGIQLVSGSVFLWGLLVYAIVISKSLPHTANGFITTNIRNDHYYCYLLPLAIPSTILFIYLNWVGMKFFRNNP